MWYKVDISEKVRDGERQRFIRIKEGYKVSCVKILMLC